MKTGSLEINRSVGSKIKEARLLANLTQNDLGKKMYKTGAAVGLIERGERGINAETLVEISRILKVPIDYFFSSEKTTTQQLQQTLEQLRKSTESLSRSLSENRKTVEKLMVDLPKTKDLRVLADMSMDPFAFVNKAGKVLYITSSIKALVGYGAEEIIGKNITKIVPKRYIAWSLKHLSRLFSVKRVRNFQARMRHKDGHLVYVEVNAQVIKKDGRYVAMGTLRDISERKSVEEDLKYRIQIEELITSVSTRLISVYLSDIEKEIKHSFSSVGRFMHADRISIFLFSSDRKRESMVCEWCRKGISSQQKNLQNLRAKDYSWFTKQIVKGRVVEIPRVADLPPVANSERKHYESEEIRSMVSVPVEFGGYLVGFIGFVWVRKESSWKGEDIRLLKMLGEISVNALSRKYTQSPHRKKEFLLEELSHRHGLKEITS